MLDLTTEAVTGWLQAIQPARTDIDWPPPLRSIETCAYADELFEELSIAFVRHQSDNNAGIAVDLSDPAVVKSLRPVLAQLGAARMLRIVALLGDSMPSGAMALLQRELRDIQTADGRTIGAALDAIAQTTLRGRLTAESRLATLLAATERHTAEEAS